MEMWRSQWSSCGATAAATGMGSANVHSRRSSRQPPMKIWDEFAIKLTQHARAKLRCDLLLMSSDGVVIVGDEPNDHTKGQRKCQLPAAHSGMWHTSDDVHGILRAADLSAVDASHCS